jgi:ribosomal protein S18 acetylase RimI-like enzyme
MTGKSQENVDVELRPVRQVDYAFVLALYVDGVQQHLTRLGRWNEKRVLDRFGRSFNFALARILCLEGEDIGWMQVSESPERFHIHQIHLLAPFRRRGIGARLIGELLARAGALGKPVALNVIIGNPAQRLYERLGFKVTGGDGELVRMLWKAESGHRDRPRAR